MPPTVIVLGVDTPIGLAVVRDLGRNGARVIGLGWTRRAVGFYSRYCAVGSIRVKNEVGLVQQLRVLAGRHDAEFLLVVSETDVDLVNRHRAEIETFVTPLVPTAETMAKVLNKEVAQGVAREMGIPVPETIQIESAEEIENALTRVRYPVAVKWANPHKIYDALQQRGIPLKKCEYARSEIERCAILEQYRPIGEFPLVQEYCPGHGLGQFFLIVSGQVIAEFQHERLHEFPPEGGVSTLCRSLPLSLHAEMRRRSRDLLRTLGWNGLAMVEYRYDPEKETYAFMEINGRFWGSFPLAIASGVSFAWGLVSCSGLGGPIPRPEPVAGRVCRYIIPETKRLFRILFQRDRIADPIARFSPLRELFDYLGLFLNPSVRYFIFQASDPVPFLIDTWFALRRLVPAKVRKRLGQTIDRAPDAGIAG